MKPAAAWEITIDVETAADRWVGWDHECTGTRSSWWSSRISTTEQRRQATRECGRCPDREACADFVLIETRGVFGPSLGGRIGRRMFAGMWPDEMRERLGAGIV